ncbi:MAG: DUF5996 family protein [Candidatus Sericytochromatia bacterium]
MTQAARWPSLSLDAWSGTLRTLHMATQVVGKVRLALAPMTNQWWQVPLYVSARGLTTSAMPHPDGVLDMEFDLAAHALVIRTPKGDRRVPLAQPTRDFYHATLAALAELGVMLRLWPQPVEVADPVRLDRDPRGEYDPDAARNFFDVLGRVEPVFHTFRAGFRGKCSPVHFFWGSFDLAVSRYPGRPAPPREGADRITRLAYDEAVSSLGFWPGGDWPGGGRFEACFYAYTSPKPEGLERARVAPTAAAWVESLGEFMLPYAEVAASSDPAGAILAFAESAYEAGARRAGWDVEALAYPPRRAPVVTFAPEAASEVTRP